MLRYVVCPKVVRPALWMPPARTFASHGPGKGDEEEITAARRWLANLDADTIRNNAVCDVSFSRSSGPGGQNVNKLVQWSRYIHTHQLLI